MPLSSKNVTAAISRPYHVSIGIVSSLSAKHDIFLHLGNIKNAARLSRLPVSLFGRKPNFHELTNGILCSIISNKAHRFKRRFAMNYYLTNQPKKKLNSTQFIPMKHCVEYSV